MSLLWLLGQVGQEDQELQRKLQVGQEEQELQPKLQVGLSQEEQELQELEPLLTRAAYRPGRAMRRLRASQLGARRGNTI